MFGKKAEDKKTSLSAQEAYNLWDFATATVSAVLRNEVWHTYAHDPDLKFLLRQRIKKLRQNYIRLNRQLQLHGVKGVDGPPVETELSLNSEVMRDEQIGKWLLLALQEEMELPLRAFRTSVTNDGVRQEFLKLALEAIDDLDAVIKYVKIKGWINSPPIYPNIPGTTKEIIDTGEAFHLWDHLTFRYDNIQQTVIWSKFAHDPEFRALLTVGYKNVLQKQAETLEQEIIKFGLPAPVKPTLTVSSTNSREILDDDYMFRMLFIGVLGATWLHSVAVKQSTTNDRIRSLFRDLLESELWILDKLMKFGKLKGWLHNEPEYRPLK